jgi:hypothetical protein
MNKIVQSIAQYFSRISTQVVVSTALIAINLSSANSQILTAQKLPREIKWDTSPSDLSLGGKTGQKFTFVCPASGEVKWIAGTDLYNYRSSICTAAAHRGLITVPSGGRVTILMRPGNPFYNGTTRNEINSEQSGRGDYSFVFVGSNGSPVVTEPIMYQLINWGTSASDLGIGQRLNQKFTYICRPNGEVKWIAGTDLYNYRSSICTAAVHSGLITINDGGKVTIEIKVGADFHNGTMRNSIRSEQGGRGDASFVFVSSPRASQGQSTEADNVSVESSAITPAQSDQDNVSQ